MNQSGFTFIEALTVVAFLSLMSAISALQYGNYKKKAFNAVTSTDIRNSMTGLQAYRDDNNGNYPSCGTTNCPSLLPGFVQTDGVQLTYVGVSDSSVTAVACHERGNTRYVFTGIPGIIIALNTGPCGS